MNVVGNLSQQLRQFWLSLTPGKRVGLVLVVLVTTAIVLAVAYWASQPDFRVLYAGLSEEDAGAIAAKLQAQGVVYRLAAGGTTVLAPADQISPLRVALAGDGLPMKSSKGYELFDQTSLGMTPFTQNVNLIRALQGELARTIMQIDPVLQARVHISKPDATPFIREQKPTTASVVLKLKPGATLNRQVAHGIIALVARSVDGLANENVTLVDTSGRLLSEERNADTGGAGSVMDYRRDLENYLSTRAESMLASVVGQGRALVRVTADINFQRHREKKETYSPEGRVAQKEKITTTKQNSSAPKGGATGTSSNVGKGGNGAGAPGGNNSEETIETDYLLSKITQELEDKAGSIERLTVAALVDLAPTDEQGNKGEPRMTLADVQDIIKQAVGFKKGRDDIKVTEVKLSSALPPLPPVEEGPETLQKWQNIVNLVKNAALGIAVLAGLLMVWMVLRRLKPSPGHAAAHDKSPVLDRLSSAARRDPQAIAQILTKWLDKSEQSRRMAA